MNATYVILLAFVALGGTMAMARDLQGFSISSGGTCVAHASSKTKKLAYDGFAKAVVAAHAKGCSDDYWGDKLVKEYCEVHDTYALALVDVFVKAATTCVTKGNTLGCALAFAEASGERSAIIKLFGAAIAKAKNQCEDCDPVAVAATFSTLSAGVFAKAEATVKAAVCTSGDSFASAEAFTHCHAKSLARGIARAHAIAAIKGKCIRLKGGYLKADAIADVDLSIDADPDCYCKGWAKVCSKPNRCEYKKKKSQDIEKSIKGKYPLTYAYFRGQCQADAYELY